MPRRGRIAGIALALALVVIVAGLGIRRLLRHGFSAREEPTSMETLLARTMRRLAVPAGVKDRKNPLPPSPATIAAGRAHFADHCAACHGNDGKGKTAIGQSLYPKAPDMTLPETQSRTDGELFATIENGIRLTGMPAWGSGTGESASETWALVTFIRHLPQIAPAELREMESLNPKSAQEKITDEEERKFLEGGDTRQ
jgi:mono/diheme cytochrome c family protein